MARKFGPAELEQLHKDTCEKCLEMMRKKNADYTGGMSVFENFLIAEPTLGIPAEKGLLLRVQDKLQRLRSFIDKGELKVVEESASDACEDVINYMILLKGMILHKEDSKTEKDEGV